MDVFGAVAHALHSTCWWDREAPAAGPAPGISRQQPGASTSGRRDPAAGRHAPAAVRFAPPFASLSDLFAPRKQQQSKAEGGKGKGTRGGEDEGGEEERILISEVGQGRPPHDLLL